MLLSTGKYVRCDELVIANEPIPLRRIAMYAVFESDGHKMLTVVITPMFICTLNGPLAQNHDRFGAKLT